MIEGELKKIASSINSVIENNNCVAWIGSGLSKITDFPEWKDFLKDLCLSCSVEPLTEEEETTGNFLKKADECKNINANIYFSKLNEVFGKDVIINRDAYHYLMQLPFIGYITTNFDNRILKAFQQHNFNDFYQYPDLPLMELNKNSRPLFYIHGLAGEENKYFVFSKTEFNEAYSGIVGSFIEILLTYFSVLFIGCRLSDDFLRNILKKVKLNHSNIKEIRPDFNSGEKILLLSPKEISETDKFGHKQKRFQTNQEFEEEISNLKDKGLTIYKYEPLDKSKHQEIEKILEDIVKKQKSKVKPSDYRDLS